MAPDIDRREMLKMPVEQRREILRQQAEGLVEYYESTANEAWICVVSSTD
ncbi:MAG TPA: hypothetical protein VFC78_18135 [Tepidisphaeraceae bacterium]|nr:hypothetical protein [Tepidisphaeraceae bacterium]